MKLIVIKLGGSVITYKDSQKPKPRLTVIKRFVREIGQIYNQNQYNIILVHGAGSYGHPLAKKYNLKHGMKNHEQKQGFALTAQKMIQLNSIIVEALLENNLSAIGLSPKSFISQSAGKLQSFDYSLIKEYLKQGIIPVLHGDVVLDDMWGCSIISGDTIVSYLAKNIKTERVIFLSDVDGVYDSDPKKNPLAELIPQIDNSNIVQVLKVLTPTQRIDVTGEMKMKIREIIDNLKNVEVYITNGLKPQPLELLLKEKVIGTRIRF